MIEKSGHGKDKTPLFHHPLLNTFFLYNFSFTYQPLSEIWTWCRVVRGGRFFSSFVEIPRANDICLHGVATTRGQSQAGDNCYLAFWCLYGYLVQTCKLRQHMKRELAVGREKELLPGGVLNTDLGRRRVEGWMGRRLDMSHEN